jgi:hypothetical protein
MLSICSNVRDPKPSVSGSRSTRQSRYLPAGMLLCLFVGIGAPSSADPPQPAKVVSGLLNSKSEAEMDHVLGEFEREDIDLSSRLSGLLKEVKVRACYLLGEMRARRSARELVEQILLADVVIDQEGRRLWTQFPCQEALVKIGYSSERHLIDALAQETHEARRSAELKVLQEIEGPRGAVLALEQRWKGAEGAEKAALEAALEQARRDKP